MLPTDRGEEWGRLDWLMPAWTRQLADPDWSAVQWLGYLWNQLHADVITGCFDDRNGTQFLRVIDRRNRQVWCVKGRELYGKLFTMGDSIFVTKDAMSDFARRHGLPAPSCWPKAVGQPARVPEELKPAAPGSIGTPSLHGAVAETQMSRPQRLKLASKAVIRDEIRLANTEAKAAGRDGLNVNKLADVVQPRLQYRGYDASKKLIKEIAKEDEFKAFRRRPGTTLASERRKRDLASHCEPSAGDKSKNLER
jgi:hypothetical protein